VICRFRGGALSLRVAFLQRVFAPILATRSRRRPDVKSIEHNAERGIVKWGGKREGGERDTPENNNKIISIFGNDTRH